MSVSSTSKVGLSAPSRAMVGNSRSQSVENIDTDNSVLVRDDSREETPNQQNFSSRQKNDFSSSELDISTSLGALSLSGMLEDNKDEEKTTNNNKINVYSNNQSIVKDEDIERIGRSYLKRFYEENEPITDVNELV